MRLVFVALVGNQLRRVEIVAWSTRLGWEDVGEEDNGREKQSVWLWPQPSGQCVHIFQKKKQCVDFQSRDRPLFNNVSYFGGRVPGSVAYNKAATRIIVASRKLCDI